MTAARRLAWLAAGIVAGALPLHAGQVVVQVGAGDGTVEILVDGQPVNADGTPVTPPDPIAMAVNDVLRGRPAILKVLPQLDRAIVSALESACLTTLTVDADEALLWVARLGDDRYATREQATQTLIDVEAEIEPALKKQLELATDPEVRWRLEQILTDRRTRPLRNNDLLRQALGIVYDRWFDELLPERSARLLNDPLDDPAALFFARAGGERIATAIAARPAAEQARLWLGAARMLTTDARAIRALAQFKPEVLAQAARESGWGCELPQPESARETVLYERSAGNSIYNLLILQHTEKQVSLVRQAFCIFEIPFGPGNPRPQTGVILRGVYDFQLDAGRMQPDTHRRLIYGVPPGMLLPKLPFVEGMDEDWSATLVRMPLWSKPYVPPEALKPTMKFVLNRGHALPEPVAADRNLTPAIAQARMRNQAAATLAAPLPSPAADPAQPPAAAEWLAFNNAADLPAAVARAAAGRQTAWIPALTAVAQTNRANAGAAALAALHTIDPAAAGQLALRLSRVRWQEDRARYAVDFLKAHYAQTALERAWDFNRRFEPPAELLQRIANPPTQP